MEVWKNPQTGKFYVLDSKTGKQSLSNRYGSERRIFKAYSTGFPHPLQGKQVPVDKLYTVQPKKFDGYCQFPRPSEVSNNKSPYTRRALKSEKIYIKEESKIPKPLNFLKMSHVKNQSLSARRPTKMLDSNFHEHKINTMDDLKQSFTEKSLTNIKTVKDLTITLEHEKQNKKGYVKPKSKAFRRKMKGFFFKRI